MTVKPKRKPLSQDVKDWLRGFNLYGGSPYGGGLYIARKAEQRRKKLNHSTTAFSDAPIGQQK